MEKVLKIIKSKDFETKSGEKGTHYTCAHKGRVFGVSTLSFEKGELVASKTTLTLKVDVEAVKTVRFNEDTQTEVRFLSLVPKLDIDFADI